MPSFDVVSELDRHELTNAVDQANREVENRFDFRGSGAKFELSEWVVTLEAPSKFQVQQMLQILTDKLARRKIDVTAMSPEEPEVALNKTKQKVVMKHGVDTDSARKIVKLIKESKIKVQAAIQGEQVRVTGKKRDDLQDAIRVLKESKLDLPLQYTNFRD
ncbi:MAG: YajQ family cyclic di-GMP-binding protein [Gammaproteobacteria bacterium]|nr:YajQ family cyclic di-GMP-binding protein [Gammaproteobacteria bacterium]